MAPACISELPLHYLLLLPKQQPPKPSPFTSFTALLLMLVEIPHPLHLIFSTGELLAQGTFLTDPEIYAHLPLALAVVGSIAVALPYVIYFQAPALSLRHTQEQRKRLLEGLAYGTLAFFLGAFVADTSWLPKILQNFHSPFRGGVISRMTDPADLKLPHYFGDSFGLWNVQPGLQFGLFLIVGSGLLFQLPVLILSLGLRDVLDHAFLSRARRYVIVTSLILAAIIAPATSPVNFLTVGAPYIALYEICLGIVWLTERGEWKRCLAT